jgi:hypothetical protein
VIWRMIPSLSGPIRAISVACQIKRRYSSYITRKSDRKWRIPTASGVGLDSSSQADSSSASFFPDNSLMISVASIGKRRLSESEKVWAVKGAFPYAFSHFERVNFAILIRDMYN